MSGDIQERLKAHARSLDGLLSLIPAKVYEGEDVSDQWKRKKQTPEQKRAARKAKLDPDNWRSAKDLQDEKEAEARKRKREEDGSTPDPLAGGADLHNGDSESVGQTTKKRKVESNETADPKNSPTTKLPVTETDEDRRKRKAEQRKAKREKKLARKAKDKEKHERKRAQAKAERPTKEPRPERKLSSHKPSEVPESKQDDDDQEIAEPIHASNLSQVTQLAPQSQAEDDEIDKSESDLEAIDHMTTSQQPSLKSASPQPGDHDDQEKDDDASTTTTSEGVASPILSLQHESGTSSISSIHPPPAPEPSKTNVANTMKEHAMKSVDADQTPKERLEARLSQLRAERKADGPEGRPARNRQELLEQRRRKEEQRQQAKKKQRRKEKEEQARKEDEEMIKRFSPGGTGSLLASPRSPLLDSGNNFTFGRVAFTDGTEADASLSSLVEQRNRKGPSDPASALKAAQNKASRLSGLDDGKRETIQQQDMWLNAKRKAHGERVKDDTSLLKKALKRKEGEKKHSEKEWSRREEGVRVGIEKRQQKRESNIQKRRDEKTSGGKAKPKVKRPGFEGSFRGRTGGKKNKS